MLLWIRVHVSDRHDMSCRGVDIHKLTSLFMHPLSEATEGELRELRKVIDWVFHTYYGKYRWNAQELKDMAELAVFERHGNFDLGKAAAAMRSRGKSNPPSAFAFVTRICMNCFQNEVRKYSRVDLCDVMPVSGSVSAEYPEISGLSDDVLLMLSGDKSFSVYEVPYSMVLPLFRFLESGLHRDLSEEVISVYLLNKLSYLMYGRDA